MKVIVWGYPLYSHTHSYIHYGFVKAFKSLGYDTYWFHDNEYPRNFDYGNSLFISEGYEDKNIPIVKSSVYFIHICININKYKDVRVIDIRYLVNFIYNHNYDYVFDDERKNKCEKIGYSYYEKLKDNSEITKFKYSPIKHNHEALYMIWATDLLPEEFNFDNINVSNDRIINYVATKIKEFDIINKACINNKLTFVHYDPWKAPITCDLNRRLISRSIIAPDFRSSGEFKKDNNGRLINGDNHLLNGYIPCRIFKSISYGKLGITNSKSVYDLFKNDGIDIVYNQDIEKLITEGLNRKDDIDLIRKQMKYIYDNHTYINRAKDILNVYNKNFNSLI